MKGVLLLMSILIIRKVSCICDSTSSEVCKLNQNTELPHVYTRHPSIDYSSLTDDTQYCDLFALQHGTWYRSSYNLITECVDHRKCGTSDPIWLNGSLPAVSDGAVDGTGCVRTFDNCCADTLGLKIRNCTYYMVYCFIDLHSSCHSRYCLDTDLSIETTTTTTTTTASTTTTTTTTMTPATTGSSNKVISDDSMPFKGAFFAVLVLFLVALVITVILVVITFKGHIEKKTQICASKASLVSGFDHSTKEHITVSAQGHKTNGLNKVSSQNQRPQSTLTVRDIQTTELRT